MNKMIAVCGLKCYECDILQASNDPKIAQEIADWFKKERGEEVKIEEIRCSGCKGDRTKHWSPLDVALTRRVWSFAMNVRISPATDLMNGQKEVRIIKKLKTDLK